jgi:GNAT superfamily N-acetyltransferase
VGVLYQTAARREKLARYNGILSANQHYNSSRGDLPMDIEIRTAEAFEASELTAIAFAAKRHWDYPEEWIDLWAGELSIDGRYIEENRVFLATCSNRTLGWCALSKEREEYWLDYCWVLPEAAGRGVGRALVIRAFRLAADLKVSTLKVAADPNAEGFYCRLGFRRIGDRASVPNGRRLPVLEADVVGAE